MLRRTICCPTSRSPATAGAQRRALPSRPGRGADGATVLRTASSRTSVLLLDFSARHRWGVRPRYATARAEAPDLASLAGAAARGGARHRRRRTAARGAGALSGACGSRRASGKSGRGCRSSSPSGRPGGRRVSRRCRRCTGGCSSRGPGGSRTSTTSPPTRPAARAYARAVCRAYLGDLDYALSYRHLAGLTDFFRRLAAGGPGAGRLAVLHRGGRQRRTDSERPVDTLRSIPRGCDNECCRSHFK